MLIEQKEWAKQKKDIYQYVTKEPIKYMKLDKDGHLFSHDLKKAIQPESRMRLTALSFDLNKIIR